jgi:hypothetical protein
MYLQKVISKKNNLLLTSWRLLAKIAGSASRSGSESGSISQSYGSADPDPYQHFIDPQHWCKHVIFSRSLGLCAAVLAVWRHPRLPWRQRRNRLLHRWGPCFKRCLCRGSVHMQASRLSSFVLNFFFLNIWLPMPLFLNCYFTVILRRVRLHTVILHGDVVSRLLCFGAALTWLWLVLKSPEEWSHSTQWRSTLRQCGHNGIPNFSARQLYRYTSVPIAAALCTDRGGICTNRGGKLSALWSCL